MMLTKSSMKFAASFDVIFAKSFGVLWKFLWMKPKRLSQIEAVTTLPLATLSCLCFMWGSSRR